MRRTPILLIPLLIASCFGPSTEPFGSPKHISVANWAGWCGLRTDIVKVFTRFFVDQTFTKGEFINQSAADGNAAYDWAELAQTDGASDIAEKLRNVALAVGHTKVAVEARSDTTSGRNELASALAALPHCVDKTPPVPKVALQASFSQTAVPVRDCLASDVTVQITTDQGAYDPGQAVRIRVLVDNTSSSACALSTNPCVANVFVDDALGTRVWESNSVKSCSPATQQTIQPGKPHDLVFNWDQLSCTVNSCSNKQVRSGNYSTHARLSLAGGANSGIGSAQFRIRTASSSQPTSTPTQTAGRTRAPSSTPTNT